MRQVQMIRTPSGVLPIVRQAAERLLAEGVISGTLDGDLHAADAATVKAAIMASAVCDFCSSPGASHTFDVPDFGISTLPGNYGAGRSTGGWAACDACADLIRANKRKALVDRAISNMAFPKFSRQMIESLLDKFWAGMDERVDATATAKVVAEYVEDCLRDGGRPVLTKRDLRVESIVRMSGLTRDEVESVVRGEISRDAVAKIVDWRKRFVGGTLDPSILADLLAKEGALRPPLPDVVPHWQRALDARFSALGSLAEWLNAAAGHEYFPETTDLNDREAVARMVKRAQAARQLKQMGFADDVKMLRVAATYSFAGETIAAIREAASSIPTETTLDEIELPASSAGWFWFGEPLPITASPVANDQVSAVLWGWTNGVARYAVDFDDALLATLPESVASKVREIAEKHDGDVEHMTSVDLDALGEAIRATGITQRQFEKMSRKLPPEPSLMFSAYVVDEKGRYLKKGAVAPSTRWYWHVGESIEQMLARCGREWERDFGAGGQHANTPHIMGKDVTLVCIGELTLFFAMACVWFKQTVPATGKPKPPVLTQETGHVERHARKRYAREHRLDAAPTVSVVALRRTERVAPSEMPADRQESAREYHCHWIVKGHPRRQVCGPGRKDRKLIWIDAHPAGDMTKPLRRKETVYAIVR